MCRSGNEVGAERLKLFARVVERCHGARLHGVGTDGQGLTSAQHLVDAASPMLSRSCTAATLHIMCSGCGAT
jgi:hypothetical protein